MRYLLMIYSDESHYARMSEAEYGKLMADYGSFTAELEQSGRFQDGQRLRPVAEATTVRVRNGDTMITDGPFAETKEQIGGFYLIEAESLDEAQEWARKIPTASYGSIEVRPVWEAEDM